MEDELCEIVAMRRLAGLALSERDPEMHQTRKGNQWYFGMKMHTGWMTVLG